MLYLKRPTDVHLRLTNKLTCKTNILRVFENWRILKRVLSLKLFFSIFITKSFVVFIFTNSTQTLSASFSSHFPYCSGDLVKNEISTFFFVILSSQHYECEVYFCYYQVYYMYMTRGRICKTQIFILPKQCYLAALPLLIWMKKRFIQLWFNCHRKDTSVISFLWIYLLGYEIRFQLPDLSMSFNTTEAPCCR